MVFPVSYIVLMFPVATLAVVLGVWRDVSLAAFTALHQKSPGSRPFLVQVNVLVCCRWCFCNLSFFTGRVVSPTQTLLSSGWVGPALVVSSDMHGRAAGLFYAQPTGQSHRHARDQRAADWGYAHSACTETISSLRNQTATETDMKQFYDFCLLFVWTLLNIPATC